MTPQAQSAALTAEHAVLRFEERTLTSARHLFHPMEPVRWQMELRLEEVRERLEVIEAELLALNFSEAA